MLNSGSSITHNPSLIRVQDCTYLVLFPDNFTLISASCCPLEAINLKFDHTFTSNIPWWRHLVAHREKCRMQVVVAGFPNPRSDTPLSFSWFVCVLALSPVHTLAVTSARMLAVPLVRIADWPPRHHLSSRRLPPKVYRVSSTSLSENVRVATDMRKSQNLFERRSETRVLSSVGCFLWTRADALSSFDNLKLLATVTRGS